MLKIERKIIEIVEKHILVISLLVGCLFALYLRKIAVWWVYPNIGSAFDMHVHHVESSFYYILVSLVQYIPILPVHGIKWLAAFSDFVLAFLCVWVVNDNVKKWETKEYIFLIACLFSPVLFIRGIVWGSLDSLAMVLLVASYKAHNSKKMMLSVLMATLAIGVYPCLCIVVTAYLFWEKDKYALWYGGIVLGGSILLLGFCSLCLGESFVQGMETIYNWSTYDSLTGAEMTEIGVWFKQIIICYGAPFSIISVILAMKKRISYSWAILLHAVVTAMYGSVLFVV